MGDVGRGFYARPGIPEFFRDHVVAAADIMTPNLFELQYLVGHETGTLSEVVEAARELRDRGPEIVVVTSVVATDAPDGLLRMLAVDADQAWLVETRLGGAATHASSSTPPGLRLRLTIAKSVSRLKLKTMKL